MLPSLLQKSQDLTRLPRLPGVSPQLQLQLDPAEDSYLFIGQARVSAIFPHCLHSPNLCQRDAYQMRRTSEESIYLDQSQRVTRIYGLGDTGCDGSR